jgi:hypothetical protein
MSSAHPPVRRKREGFSRSLAGRYSEDRWKDRFRPPTAPFQLSSRVEKEFEYLPELLGLCPDHHEMAVQDAKLKEPGRKTEDPERLARMWLQSEHWLAAVPTVILAGMYGAAAFSLLSLGPAWAGFLAVSIPVLGVGAWASFGPP